MKSRAISISILLSIIFTGISHAQEKSNDFPVLTGLYLGQEPPGLLPKVFAEVIVSKDVADGGCVFPEDGSEIYYFISNRRGKFMIMQSRIKKSCWLQPITAKFSGTYSDVHPFLSNDGSKLFFGSNRPIKANERVPYFNLWFVEKKGNHWSDPTPLSSTINTGFENCGSIGPDGTLYFRRVSKRTRGDIFQSHFINGKFQDPAKLPHSINSIYDESHPCISPDGSYIIFSSKRPGGWNHGRDDLWISFKRKDDSWTMAKNMGKNINTGHNTSCATISPDGNYLFFSSMKSGNGDTYWVDAKIIDNYKPKGIR